RATPSRTSSTMNARIASLLSTSRAVLRRFQLWPFVFILAVCGSSFLIGEQFPVTRFPMYDKFPDHTYFLYVGDSEGNPVPIKELTGINTSKLKKPYDKELNRTRKRLKKRKLELTAGERRSAGEDTLRKLYNDAPAAGKQRMAQLAPLQLFHVWIFSEKGRSAEQPAEAVASYTPEDAIDQSSP
ncbi:MAG: hypothetical protein ACR2RV_13705, partial [Verrucomicrobiales bacterium]